MCKFKGIGPSCNGEVLRRGVSQDEIQEILSFHNKFRAKIARGEEKRGRPGPQPPAANMRKMEWDDELATVAQRHADQCNFAHDCSDCRKVDRFGVGQNLYIYKQSLRAPATNWGKAVTDWYDEVKLFSNKKVEPFKFSAAIGHFSQLVWADTDKVGCGATTYKDGKWFATLYTCNYGPNGNFIRGQMYKQGSACSSCPDNHSCSREIPGLCESGSSAPAFKPKGTPSPLPPPTRFVPVQTPRPTTRRTTRPTTTTTTTTTTTPTTTTRRITTERVKTTVTSDSKIENDVSLNSTLFSCSFEGEQDACEIRTRGVKWTKDENYFSGVKNYFLGTELGRNQKTEMFFEKLIPTPKGGIACLDFKYKKFSTEDSVALTVLAWPFKGKPGKVNIIRDSPDSATWIRAQVTFRNIENYFLVMMRSQGPRNQRGLLQLAIDDVVISAGVCSS